MIPFCSHTVTLYHHEGGDVWTAHILRGVRFCPARQRDASGGSAGTYNAHVKASLVIPAEVPVPAISAGGKDYVIHGEGQPITDDYTPADLRRDHPEMCAVESVKDNTGAPGLKHWKVICA